MTVYMKCSEQPVYRQKAEWSPGAEEDWKVMAKGRFILNDNVLKSTVMTIYMSV